MIKELAGHGGNIIAVGGPHTSYRQDKYICEYVTLDLSRADEARKINFSDVTNVIHLAGLAAVAPSFNNPMLYINTNVGIQVNLFEAALAQKTTPRFLIVSSSTLYDASAPQPLTEESPLLPNSPYAVSKLGQELMAQYYAARGFECIVARPFNHIGPGQGSGFIAPDLAMQLVAGQEVFVGNLDAKRDYTDVRDIVRAYRLLLEKGLPSEIYNICSGKPLSGHEVLAGLSKAAGVEPIIKTDAAKMRPSDTPLISGSCSKITRDTGWEPEIPLETTFANVVASLRSRAEN